MIWKSCMEKIKGKLVIQSEPNLSQACVQLSTVLALN